MNSKSFEELLLRFKEIRLPDEIDLIVAVANGGIIPAAIINQRLSKEIQLLKLNLRDNMQNRLYDQPVLLEEIDFDIKGKKILLVEDRVKTGTTLEFAKKLLLEKGADKVLTFAVNGNADFCLFNESCFMFPWIIK
jgi:xanthine phosphoribosyltransferase